MASKNIVTKFLYSAEKFSNGNETVSYILETYAMYRILNGLLIILMDQGALTLE